MKQNINIKKKIAEFVKYHNAFVIMMVLALVGVGSVFASEDVRDAVIGEEVVVETKGLDNSAILAADLENFDAMMQIIGVTEDAENYFVEYAYQTLAIQDNAWAEFTRQEILDVSKAALMSRDLGFYLIEELGEIVESELALLKEVQKNELAKGRTEIVETTDYTGLIGLVLDVKNKILPEYEPVVQTEVPVEDSIVLIDNPEFNPAPAPVIAPILGCMDSTATNYNPSVTENDGSCVYPPVTILGCMDSTATNYNPSATENDGSCVYPPLPPAHPAPIYGCMDSTALNYNSSATENDGSCVYPLAPVPGCMDSTALNYNPDATSDDGNCEYSAPPVDEPADVCDADHLDLCNTQELCEGIGLYWYNEVCNTTAEEPPADVCDAEHIDLCDTQDLCETAGLYWYDDICNLETQVILGCVDETAVNYNAEATQDDGSCEYPPEPVLGCMDSTALNYNPDATEDDGTCEYPAPICESFTYSDWSECSSDGTQTRTILLSLPDGCVDGSPVVSQTCEYEPDPDQEEE